MEYMLHKVAKVKKADAIDFKSLRTAVLQKLGLASSFIGKSAEGSREPAVVVAAAAGSDASEKTAKAKAKAKTKAMKTTTKNTTAVEQSSSPAKRPAAAEQEDAEPADASPSPVQKKSKKEQGLRMDPPPLCCLDFGMDD